MTIETLPLVAARRGLVALLAALSLFGALAPEALAGRECDARKAQCVSTRVTALLKCLQGVAIQLGTGRVYVSGEAGGLTAQVTFGMQFTPENERFLRNVIAWLDD